MKIASKIIQHYKDKNLVEKQIVNKLKESLTEEEFLSLYNTIFFRKTKILKIMFNIIDNGELE